MKIQFQELKYYRNIGGNLICSGDAQRRERTQVGVSVSKDLKKLEWLKRRDEMVKPDWQQVIETGLQAKYTWEQWVAHREMGVRQEWDL